MRGFRRTTGQDDDWWLPDGAPIHRSYGQFRKIFSTDRTMKVIYEDSVDWEPLHLRFRLKGTPTSDRCEALANFIVEWIRQRERDDPDKWQFCEYSANVRADGTVEAFCELMPPHEVQPLADAVAERFPFVAELRLGEPETGSPH